MSNAESSQPKRRVNPILKAKRSHDRLLSWLLAALVLISVVTHFLTPDREFSPQENRKLAQIPQCSLAALADGSYFSGVSSWFADQFFARDGWLSLRLALDTLRGSKESGGVYLGKDGYLLEKPVVPGESLQHTLSAMTEFAGAHRDIPMRMLLLPCAASVLPEQLPDNAPVRDQQADIQYVREALAPDVAVLETEFDTSVPIYYKTDHHWTSQGAHQAFLSAAPELGIDSQRVTWKAHPVSHSFQGTLSSKSGRHRVSDTVTVYEPSPETPYYLFFPDTQIKTGTLFRTDCLEAKDQYTLFLGGNYPLVEIRTTANNGRNLLLFKDSYANCFVQFLTPYYETIIMVDPRYCYDSADSLMSAYNITEVLYLYSANTFLADTTLADILRSE